MKRISIITILSFLIIHSDVIGQPSLSFDLKKPPKFENKTLASEKTGTKKFTVTRHFLQNTFTHYNYYFNANNRLNEIVARAKTSLKDDYTELLPFYNYTLQATAAYKTDLDSVIYKSTAGVLIHDLRNDWIDNLYLLIGRAYYLRNDLDSAYLTFQFINYTFSPKEKDGYNKVIGSNQNEGSNAFSISTKENRNIINKAFSEAPSRNESLVWQIKTYLAKDEMGEASGLIETLKHDPSFPSRLNTDLEEVRALFFYKQLLYDSAAFHLEKALDNAEDNQEQARWEYLIAQLYERTGKHDLAEKFYNKAIQHTINPVLEVYARLNAIRQNKNGSEKEIQEAIDALVKMARKDKYLSYRDIIYYTASIIELERNKPEAAKLLLLKSIKTNTNNIAQKNRSFLALGDLTFNQKLYTEAKNFYDSVDVQTVAAISLKMFTERKAALEKIVMQTGVLERQDSLQRIAAMPVIERDAFIKKLVKQLRKQQGIKEDDSGVIDKGTFGNNKAEDLFSNNTSKGDWYFSNPSLKGKGLNDFKAKWGNRLNADNWRRLAASANSPMAQQPKGKGFVKMSDAPAVTMEISFESLLGNLPITPEKQKISKDSVENSLFEVGKAYMSGLEDYTSAINAFEKLLTEFPATLHAEEAWYNLHYCYSKTGSPANQLKVKQMLASKFPNGKFSRLLNISRLSQSPDSIQKNKATVQYESVYNLFLEGNFEEALKRKKVADSVYGQHFWTPQLLYIEAVYNIHQQSDSTARVVLGNILKLFPASPMYNKAVSLIEVLGRRKQIEDYLTNLDLKKLEADLAVESNDKPLLTQGIVVPKGIARDSIAKNADAEKEAAALKAKKEGEEVKAARELQAKKELAEKEAAAVEARRKQDSLTTARDLQVKKDLADKAAAAVEAKRKLDSITIARDLQVKKDIADKAAAAVEARRKQDSLVAAKELQVKKDKADLAAQKLKEQKELAEKAAQEIRAQKDLAEKADKESKQKKQLEADIAARETQLKKQAAEIAAKELLALKEQKEIAANEKKAKDLAEKEAKAKETTELAQKALADKVAKDKIAKELADKELADKTARNAEAKRRADSSRKADLSEKEAKAKEATEQAQKALADKAAKDKIAKELADKELADITTRNAEAKRRADSVAKADLVKKMPVVTNATYSNKPAEAHYVVLVLEKVDPVYATEARNAFNRYHRENYNDKNIGTSSYSLSDDTKLLLINNFENAASALNYVEKARKLTSTEIIPWLTPQKYSFLLISASNLEILKNTKNITFYKKFLKELYPDKF
ncbi:MAG: hypothetical protein ABIN89_07580 [Chitinophagaceae bacterium]